MERDVVQGDGADLCGPQAQGIGQWRRAQVRISDGVEREREAKSLCTSWGRKNLGG